MDDKLFTKLTKYGIGNPKKFHSGTPTMLGDGSPTAIVGIPQTMWEIW